jgi:hypothetical protein
MSLDQWLQATSPDALHCPDAWAIRDTNRAFAFNNYIGVENSHRSNEWFTNFARYETGNFLFGNPFVLSRAASGHGTYVYISNGPYKILDLQDPLISTVEIENEDIPNNIDETLNHTFTYTVTKGQSTKLTVTESTSLKVSSSFELDGFSFGLEASYDTSKTNENEQSQVATTSITDTIQIPPHKHFTLAVSQETTRKEMIYGIDLAIASESPEGCIGKCTNLDPRDQANWNRFFPIEKIANTTQTAKHHVITDHVVTKIKSGERGQETTVTHG